jgi:diguanylate cyclase (GGDEF)-like protein
MRRRLSLLGTFGLLSFLVIAALGVAIGGMLHGRVERRALIDLGRDAQLLGRIGVQSQLTPADLEHGMSPRRLDEVGRALRASSLADSGLSRVKVYNVHGTIVYSDERAKVGQPADSDEVEEALEGEVETEIAHGTEETGRGAKMLEAYVPLRWRAHGPIVGVVEIYVPYAPVAASIADDTRTLALLLAGGLVLLYGVLFRIVSSASRRLQRLALHDELTGLPNRTLLYERTERALAKLPRDGESLAALLLIDLDRFKEVNDTLGHDHGDELLCEVATRLRGALRHDDTLARLGGDEFAVLLPDVPHRGAVAELADRLASTLERPFALRGVAVQLGASIGIALSPEHGADVNTLVRRADVAMYDAKRTRSHIETYAPERDPHSPERLALLGELRGAIEGDEFELHYQPKVALDSGAVIGVEALVRWRHPRRGLLMPGDFIGLAERSGLMSDFTGWVLDKALAQYAAWREAGIDLPVAVNLAAANVVDADLPTVVAEALARHGVPADRLECEISEDTVMADPHRVADVLHRLRALGVRLSLDDFGTGRSSLTYLKELPLDDLKIDRSFVASLAEDADDAAIVASTIGLARSLGLGVVAEGVETEQVLDRLAELHCDIAQGYYLSRPLPAAEFDGWLAARATA